MNEKMNGGISTMRGIFCRLPYQKGGITAKPLRHKALTAASFLSTHDKKHRKLRFSVLFCCKNAENGVGRGVGQWLTHTPTHTRKCADRFKEYRRGGFAPSPIFLMFFFCSHHLCHETAHFLRGLLLHLPCDVGVGSQGEARVVVPEH